MADIAIKMGQVGLSSKCGKTPQAGVITDTQVLKKEVSRVVVRHVNVGRKPI
jgi:hypothetical protein